MCGYFAVQSAEDALCDAIMAELENSDAYIRASSQEPADYPTIDDGKPV
jgi:hypothetical protein